jgi:hypothetical protein
LPADWQKFFYVLCIKNSLKIIYYDNCHKKTRS